MTVIYTNVVQKFNKIFFRGYKDGVRVQSSDAKYVPQLFVPQEQESKFKTIYGENLRPIELESVAAAKAFVKDNGSMLSIHGNTKYEFDFIHQNFTGELDVTIDQLTVVAIDIETTTGGRSLYPDSTIIKIRAIE